MDAVLSDALGQNGPVLIEVMVDSTQPFAPKLASKRLEDGTMYSPPLDDMAHFLDRDEYGRALILLQESGT